MELADAPISREQALAFLTEQLGTPPGDVAQIGAGAWSQCFAFTQNRCERVIRFGKYVEDFEKDRIAHRYTSPSLPVPQVLDIGLAWDGYYAISTRMHGNALESVSAEQWLMLIPAIVDMLEAMRLADISHTQGFGGWGSDGKAGCTTWEERLLSVADDTPDQRGHGWRERLTAHPEGKAAFAWGYDILRQVASDDIPRSLLHCDLSNRNVLVQDAHITGVLDWGCSIYGDHLYDLALFEFWEPWHPQLNISVLKSTLQQHWQELGCTPNNIQARLAACHLHIGLEHLAYHAQLGNWEHLSDIAKRMYALVPW